jgi:DNA-binding NtrC family response regulator
MARILVVDDEEGIRDGIRRALKPLGHEVILADDGLEATRVIREVGADLALVDIHMPKMDGIELLITFQAAAPAMPVIVMSGGGRSRQLDMLPDARLLGAIGILAKPFTLDELQKVVNLALAAGPRADAG